MSAQRRFDLQPAELGSMPESNWWTLHEAACTRGDATYTDPSTGHQVFTRLGLLERGRCCAAGCRHCPFGHDAVRLSLRAGTIQQPAWLSETRPDPDQEHAVLFWNGSANSYLAYRAMLQRGDSKPVLLTPFDARDRIVRPHNIPIAHVACQAKSLDAALIGVPLHAGSDLVDQVGAALTVVPDCVQLSFENRQDTRAKRAHEDMFRTRQATASLARSFPLWCMEQTALLADLAASRARCEISALGTPIADVAVGDTFDAQLAARLPPGIDPFGEDGAFYTRVVF